MQTDEIDPQKYRVLVFFENSADVTKSGDSGDVIRVVVRGLMQS